MEEYIPKSKTTLVLKNCRQVVVVVVKVSLDAAEEGGDESRAHSKQQQSLIVYQIIYYYMDVTCSKTFVYGLHITVSRHKFYLQ